MSSVNDEPQLKRQQAEALVAATALPSFEDTAQG